MIEIESRYRNALKEYKFIDLFCGIGGFHLALSSFGAKCVFASEIDPHAVSVYKDNFNIEPKGDITKIHAKDIPLHDIICAGFPCQSFSISGKLNGLDDPNGQLYKNIVRIAKHHKPKLILMENVKNLEVHDKRKTLDIIKQDFARAGYKLFTQVLNASDFGVPQSRQRLYLIAFRKDLAVKEFLFPVGDNRIVSLELVLEENPCEQSFVNRDFTLHNNEPSEPVNRLVRIGSIGKGRQGERIYSRKGHAATLSSQGGGLGGRTGMYLVGNRIRKLTTRECARVMGFPEKFKIADKPSTCYNQFGNSVVVDVLQEILKCAVAFLKGGI